MYTFAVKKTAIFLTALILTTSSSAQEVAAPPKAYCAPNATLLSGQTDKGIWIAWWCDKYNLELYVATWNWLNYDNKQKLIPLIKKSITAAQIAEAAKKNVTKDPYKDPELLSIWKPSEPKIMALRPKVYKLNSL